DHSVPVFSRRGRIQIVVSSVGGVRPIQRQSDTITCVAPIAVLRANCTGTESLTPPSVSSSCSPPQQTSTVGNSRGIEALTQTAGAQHDSDANGIHTWNLGRLSQLSASCASCPSWLRDERRRLTNFLQREREVADRQVRADSERQPPLVSRHQDRDVPADLL